MGGATVTGIRFAVMIAGLAVMIAGLAVMVTVMAAAMVTAGFLAVIAMVVATMIAMIAAAIMAFLGFLNPLCPSFFHTLHLCARFRLFFFAHVVPTFFHPGTN